MQVQTADNCCCRVLTGDYFVVAHLHFPRIDIIAAVRGSGAAVGFIFTAQSFGLEPGAFLILQMLLRFAVLYDMPLTVADTFFQGIDFHIAQHDLRIGFIKGYGRVDDGCVVFVQQCF